MISSILLIVACICLFAAAFNFSPSPKISLFPLGVALWCLSVLLRPY